MENIRITSGEFRGRTIKSPRSKLTHPMGSREKMALFNMISGYLSDATVLDAYSGSGALGIEALSRGAKKVVFVEKNSHAASIIKTNINTLGLVECTSVIESSVDSFSYDKKFDIIIADPPYDNFNSKQIEKIANFLKEDGVFVLSHPKDVSTIEGLRLQKTHTYAAAHISVYINQSKR